MAIPILYTLPFSQLARVEVMWLFQPFLPPPQRAGGRGRAAISMISTFWPYPSLAQAS